MSLKYKPPNPPTLGIEEGSVNSFRVYAGNFNGFEAVGYTLHPRNVLWYRGGLVFEAHRLLYHSAYGSRIF